MKIKKVRGREIYDSRGCPTLACDLWLHDGTMVTSAVPSGLSRSQYEAREMRDGGPRLQGMGVLTAIARLEKDIAPLLIGNEPNIVSMDAQMVELDGTADKSRLGANSMLAASIAICKAQAHMQMMELYAFIAEICDFETVAMPIPMFNMINGGLHADSKLSVQEFLVIPDTSESFRHAYEFGSTTYHYLKQLLKAEGKSVAVGDEGGFAAHFSTTEEVLVLLKQAIEQASQEVGGSAVIGLDVAASYLYDQRARRYTIDKQQMSSSELTAWYMMLHEKYDLHSIEDGFHVDDLEGLSRAIEVFTDQILLISDDLFATNPERIWKGLEQGITTGVIIKPNQIGTVTETLQAIKLCEEASVPLVASHRSGETEDAFIADLAVGVSAQYIKAGGLSRGERISKYNRVLAIEQDLFSCDEPLQLMD